VTELATKTWTYEDYLALPEDGNRYEIIEGDLYVTPAPSIGHQDISGEIYSALRHFVRRHELGKVYYAPFEVHLSATTRPVQPDVLFIRTENVPSTRELYFMGVPDLVVEIFSPSTHRIDQTIKYDAYQNAGVAEYWMVDPLARTVWVYTLQEGQYALHGQFVGNDTITSKVLVGLEIVNSTLFDSP
jgi:Uma2 family endonuclease